MPRYAIVTGYYGENVRRELDHEKTWETVQAIYRETCPIWHNGTLVEISRSDGGCAYNAPGVFLCRDIEGAQTVVILED